MGVATRRRIALIESDELIRRLALRWLKAAGHAAFATNLSQLRVGQDLLMVIADVSSVASAESLVQRVRMVRDVPLLLVSARFHRGQAASQQLSRQLGVAAVLAKPYGSSELVEAVSAALASAAGGSTDTT